MTFKANLWAHTVALAAVCALLPFDMVAAAKVDIPPVVVAADAVDPISGGAGWVGTGLLGGVLSWLMFVYLPAKDKQMQQLLAEQRAERNDDRSDRMKIATGNQAAITDLIRNDHDRSEKDRMAFMARTSLVEQAIVRQTSELRQEIKEALAAARAYAARRSRNREASEKESQE